MPERLKSEHAEIRTSKSFDFPDFGRLDFGIPLYISNLQLTMILLNMYVPDQTSPMRILWQIFLHKERLL